MKCFLVFIILVFMLELSLRALLPENDLENLNKVIQPTKINLKKQKTKDLRLERSVKRDFTNINSQSKVPHPYFGHVYNRAKNKEINRDGFFEKNDLHLIEKSIGNKYYIGIFGGSVAKGFAFQQSLKRRYKVSGLVQKLQEGAPKYFKDKEIVVLNFGVSAYKQPQQFIVSSFYSSKIHMAIFIDGYNEISHPYMDIFNPNYPSYSNLFYSLDPSRNKYLSELYDIINFRIELAQDIQKLSYIKKSYIFGRIWIIFDNFLQKKINNTHNFFRAKLDKSFPYYRKDEFEKNDERAAKQAKIWSEFTLKQHILLKAENIDVFNFIQPNQHVYNSKKLSNAEIFSFYDKERVPWLNIGYSKLFEESLKLKKKGVKIHDLTKIFLGTNDTVYKDSCCHLNEVGREVMENSVVEIILKKLKSKDF